MARSRPRGGEDGATIMALDVQERILEPDRLPATALPEEGPLDLITPYFTHLKTAHLKDLEKTSKSFKKHPAPLKHFPTLKTIRVLQKHTSIFLTKFAKAPNVQMLPLVSHRFGKS